MTKSTRQSINDIELSSWREYSEIDTNSLWIVNKPERAEASDAGYHGLFIPEIPRQMILRYTRKGEVVFDPFIGAGTTAFEAMKLGRHIIGIDLNADTLSAAGEKLKDHRKHLTGAGACAGGAYLINADSRGDIVAPVNQAVRMFNQTEIALAILHPPYHNIIRFSEDIRDLSNSETVDFFLMSFREVVENVRQLLPEGRYMVIVIGDIYEKGEVVPLSSYCMNVALLAGFRIKGIIVKNITNNRAKRNQENLWRYRHLKNGTYNFGHEMLYVLQKK